MITLLILLFVFAVIYWGGSLFLPPLLTKVLGVILGLIWILKALAFAGYSFL